MKHYDVKTIKLYIPNAHDSVTKHTFTYSNIKGSNNTIEDLLNEKGIPDKNLIAIEIIFT